VLLDGQDLPPALLGVGDERGSVDGLDGERVEDADVDALLGKLVGGLERLLQGHAAPDDEHLVVVALADHFRLPHLSEQHKRESSVKEIQQYYTEIEREQNEIEKKKEKKKE
jgi:hypothetical protein